MSTDPTSLTIPKVTVLTGHVDKESAYLVEDHPSGGLRCKARYWIETGTRKPYQGDQRFVRQTTNPKRPGDVWNKPHKGTFSPLVALYLDEKNHVHGFGVPTWARGDVDTRVRAMGIYEGFTDADRRTYDLLLAASRKVNPSAWTRWEEEVAALADHISAHGGADPQIVNSKWVGDNGRPHYMSDPAAYVTAARNLIVTR